MVHNLLWPRTTNQFLKPFRSTNILYFNGPLRMDIHLLVVIGFPNEQTRQPVFLRLLQSACRLAMCSWLTGQQKYSVENCIRTLSDIGTLPLESFALAQHSCFYVGYLMSASILWTLQRHMAKFGYLADLIRYVLRWAENVSWAISNYNFKWETVSWRWSSTGDRLFWAKFEDRLSWTVKHQFVLWGILTYWNSVLR